MSDLLGFLNRNVVQPVMHPNQTHGVMPGSPGPPASDFKGYGQATDSTNPEGQPVNIAPSGDWQAQNKSGPAPAAQTAAQNPYGFDPLSFGLAFQNVIGPWMAQQGKTFNAEDADYAKNMASALKGASPQLQAAFKTSVPAVQQAMAGENQALEGSAITSPEFDALVSGLNTATTAAHAAQYSAAEMPYVAQTQGLGSPAATAGGNAQTNANLAQYLQQVLAGQSVAPTTGITAINPASTAASQAANQQTQNAYAQSLLQQSMG